MKKRVFILGAGFSKPAGMPLATELLPLLLSELGYENTEMKEWITGLQERLEWLSGNGLATEPLHLNIEQVFHLAQFDIEQFRLGQHLTHVGRRDGPGTPWNASEAISAWLSYLEEALRDTISKRQDRSDLASISRWAKVVQEKDAVLTFNYDTLAERALTQLDKLWNHATGREVDRGVAICKLHGSIDWIVADRKENFRELDLLFDKPNSNRGDERTGHVEDDCRLWRCQTNEQRDKWIRGRDLQSIPEGAWLRTVGIAGLGSYKPLHHIPGLGRVWSTGMRALFESDAVVVVGFSMSDFDAMAQMQFAIVARKRHEEGRPLFVTVIDPMVDGDCRARFRRVFRDVRFVERCHEQVDWSEI